MKHTFLPISILCALSLLPIACRTHSESHLSDVNSCASGRPYYLTLVAQGTDLPGYTELRVPQFRDPTQIPGVVAANPDHTIRLDLCVTDDVVDLHKVVLMNGPDVVIIGDGSTGHKEGLERTFFDHDYSGLNLEIPLIGKPAEFLILRGAANYKGAYFTFLQKTSAGVVLKAPRDPIVFGVFDAPDADKKPRPASLSANNCNLYDGLRKSNTFTVDTATFTLDACFKGEMIVGPSLLKLVVTDSSKQLDQQTRGRTFEVPIGSYSLGDRKKANESLFVNLPHAVYAIKPSSVGIGLTYRFLYIKSGKDAAGSVLARKRPIK
ncbi:MAG: hypothetical protein H7249_08260 [Chitinophagaceae bacterium]|nr:hypothetical protein [Oligoflexus sp.]